MSYLVEHFGMFHNLCGRLHVFLTILSSLQQLHFPPSGMSGPDVGTLEVHRIPVNGLPMFSDLREGAWTTGHCWLVGK